MRIRVALLGLAILLVAPATALGSLADEQRQGQQLAAQLQSGAKRCSDLSADDFDHIGEYVMFRALGSTSLHQAMNDRMTAMMGEQGESRMHQLLGQRYVDCHSGTGGTGASGAIGPGMMGGSGMMGGYYGNGGWSAMMNSADWSWMMGGAWQHMTRQNWQQLQQRLLGTTTPSQGGGWSPLAIIAVTLAGVMLAALTILAVIRRSFKRPPAAAAPS